MQPPQVQAEPAVLRPVVSAARQQRAKVVKLPPDPGLALLGTLAPACMLCCALYRSGAVLPWQWCLSWSANMLVLLCLRAACLPAEPACNCGRLPSVKS